jgi:hypothetical protein
VRAGRRGCCPHREWWSPVSMGTGAAGTGEEGWSRGGLGRGKRPLGRDFGTARGHTGRGILEGAYRKGLTGRGVLPYLAGQGSARGCVGARHPSQPGSRVRLSIDESDNGDSGGKPETAAPATGHGSSPTWAMPGRCQTATHIAPADGERLAAGEGIRQEPGWGRKHSAPTGTQQGSFRQGRR